MMKKILCFFGFHKWVWKYKTGDVLPLDGSPPSHARCKYCGIRYDNDDFEGYPS